MKIEKISYQVTIPVQSFVYDKIGVEASVDSDSEDISECFDQLKRTADGLCRQAYPHLYSNGGSINSIRVSVPYGMAEDSIEIPLTLPRQDPEPEENISLLDRIKNSANVRELEGWRLLVSIEKDEKKKSELQSAYDKKMGELKQKQNA